MTEIKAIEIALYQPDIPGNTGTILRLAACLGAVIHVIEPAGFDLSDRALKRAGMDYLEMAALRRHVSWREFDTWRKAEAKRLVLLTTKADTPYTAHGFEPADILLFGRESADVFFLLILFEDFLDDPQFVLLYSGKPAIKGIHYL